MQNINKRASRSKESRKDSSDDVAITVEVLNNCQPADGKSQEAARATVTYKGQRPPPGQTYSVHFELNSVLSTFIDSHTFDTDGDTDANGVVTKYFFDGTVEGDSVSVRTDGGWVADSAQYTFFATDDPYNIDLELQNNGATADGVASITAQATLKKDAAPYSAAAAINFQIMSDDNDAQFYATDGTPLGQTASAQTDPETGIASVLLKSSKSELGRVKAWWQQPPAGDSPYQILIYNFGPPGSQQMPAQLKFNPLTTQADDTNKTIEECATARRRPISTSTIRRGSRPRPSRTRPEMHASP
jgi:hypothetical protein